MLLYKKNGNGYVVIEPGYDQDGNVIVTPGTTNIDPPPYRDGYSLTLDENLDWIYVEEEITPVTDLENVRYYKKIEYGKWEEGYVNRPFIYDGDIFVNDSRFREMLNSAIGALREWDVLPKFWLTAEKKVIQPVTKEFLDGIGKTAYNEHQDSMFTAITVEEKIESAKTVSEIEEIVFPETPTVESLREELDKKEK